MARTKSSAARRRASKVPIIPDPLLATRQPPRNQLSSDAATAAALRAVGYRGGADREQPFYTICVCSLTVPAEQELDVELLIRCGNRNCPKGWFHLACVNLPAHPPMRLGWTCPECIQTHRITHTFCGLYDVKPGRRAPGQDEHAVARQWYWHEERVWRAANGGAARVPPDDRAGRVPRSPRGESDGRREGEPCDDDGERTDGECDGECGGDEGEEGEPCDDDGGRTDGECDGECGGEAGDDEGEGEECEDEECEDEESDGEREDEECDGECECECECEETDDERMGEEVDDERMGEKGDDEGEGEGEESEYEAGDEESEDDEEW